MTGGGEKEAADDAGPGAGDTGSRDGADEADEYIEALKRRLKGFGFHLALYFVIMVILATVNFFYWPDNPWFVLPMVGWGSVLGLHVAYAMGLFGGLFKSRR